MRRLDAFLGSLRLVFDPQSNVEVQATSSNLPCSNLFSNWTNLGGDNSQRTTHNEQQTANNKQQTTNSKAENEPAPRARAGVLLIRRRSGTVTATEALEAHGVTADRPVGSNGWLRVRVTDSGAMQQKLSSLQNAGYDAEPDWVVSATAVPNDPYWAKNAAAMNSIAAPAAWDLHTGNKSVSVCIIDSGINYFHPDLMANVDLFSYNAITNVEGARAAADDSGHGSHCAGTVGAVGNNTEGVVGVNWRVKLLACKFLDKNGQGATSDAIECLQWCRGRGAKVSSNSWGSGGFSQALADEIQLSQNAGHLFVTSAGNDNLNIDTSPQYPAAYQLDNIITVGALNVSSGGRASFSNYGAQTVDLFAPGVNIFSTVLGANYSFKDGTSMACQHVAGAAALLWSYRPSLTYAKVRASILQSAQIMPSLRGLSVAGGTLNVSSLLSSSVFIRLANSTEIWEGRLEVLVNGVWGTVCDENFGVIDANVACRQLGLPWTARKVYSSAYPFGVGTGPILMDNVACTGSEAYLQSCQYTPYHDCTHVEDVRLACLEQTVPSSIRLAGGRTNREGRLEVLVDGIWGTVCDDNFGELDARVACRQLGLNWASATVFPNAWPFGQGAGPIWLDDVACMGFEGSLQSCPHTFRPDCLHSEDVGISCPG